MADKPGSRVVEARFHGYRKGSLPWAYEALHREQLMLRTKNNTSRSPLRRCLLPAAARGALTESSGGCRRYRPYRGPCSEGLPEHGEERPHSLPSAQKKVATAAQESSIEACTNAKSQEPTQDEPGNKIGQTSNSRAVNARTPQQDPQFIETAKGTIATRLTV